MDQIFIVMDYVEHDIKNLMNYSMKEPFMIGEYNLRYGLQFCFN